MEIVVGAGSRGAIAADHRQSPESPGDWRVAGVKIILIHLKGGVRGEVMALLYLSLSRFTESSERLLG